MAGCQEPTADGTLIPLVGALSLAVSVPLVELLDESEPGNGPQGIRRAMGRMIRERAWVVRGAVLRRALESS